MTIRGLFFLATLFAGISTAQAQESAAISSARAAGAIGEKFDGYIGYVAAPSVELRRQVDALNIRRRSLYFDLANRRGVSPQEVGIAAGCELLARVPVGGAYQLGDGNWQRRNAGENITPSYCGDR